MTRFSRTALRLNLPLQVPRTRPRRIAYRADWTRKIPEAGKARRKPTFQPKSAIRLRAEADKMPESTIAAIGNAPASLMTDLGPIAGCRNPGKECFPCQSREPSPAPARIWPALLPICRTIIIFAASNPSLAILVEMKKLAYRIQSLRPHTLPLSVSGIILGSFLAYPSGSFSWPVFGLALPC